MVRKVTITIAIVSTVTIMAIVGSVSRFRSKHQDEAITYGVSFSKPYAESLGLDWQAAYKALLADAGFKHLRLMSYWDQHEPQRDKYDFTDLDYQFAQAAKYGAKVSLAIGLRQPRWPECREPAWALQLDDAAWQTELSRYIGTVVKRYRSHPFLESWQLENEFGNVDFGGYCRNFDRQRLQAEYDLAQQLDPDHPIIMNMSNQIGLPISQPRPNVFGISIYKRVYEARLLKRYVTHPVPAWYHSLRAAIIELTTKRPVIIHELQAEPWSAKSLADTSLTEQQQTMSLIQLERNLEFAKKTGIKTMYLWGGEWWYWRLSVHNDPSYWSLIKAEIN